MTLYYPKSNFNHINKLLKVEDFWIINKSFTCFKFYSHDTWKVVTHKYKRQDFKNDYKIMDYE